MSKVFQSSSISKILSTNKPNTIEVNNNNIIESDSEFREVIKKGYLLSQINLSTIPDIIQDAIDKAILDAKTQTLADSLISTMRQTIENFDDGVYKKTYIDTTITYLEELLTQKASPEIAASIAEAKIAIATAEFATASQVGNLSSRVGSSESEILNVKETITTKDVARATQIEELQASINQSLSNYSEAIDLYVDANGNVKSQKIEKLEAGNSISKVTINELNEVVADAEGNYTAITSKVILDSDGKIVGFKFTDTNAISAFKINTDVFEISNSTNSYTPFSIVGNDLLFNGRVTFSNITGGENIVTKQNVQDAINNNVTSINGGKIVTNEAFVNNLNAIGGVIAETISADEINGITINGGIINGARINGVVIKTSYLDLDGELEVLTNYHISVAMYNASPSTYSDAVYISADNEYRIPSISSIKYNAVIQNTVNTHIYAYNVANVGRNTKAVKINPTIVFDFSANKYSDKSLVYSAKSYDSINGANSCSWAMYLGSSVILSVVGSNNSATVSGMGGSSTISTTGTKSVSVTIGNAVFSISIGVSTTYSFSAVYIRVSTNRDIIDLTTNFTNGSITFNTTGNSNARIYHNIPSVSINNMI